MRYSSLIVFNSSQIGYLFCVVLPVRLMSEGSWTQQLYLSPRLRGGITREGQRRFRVPHSHPEDGKVPMDWSLYFHFPAKYKHLCLPRITTAFRCKVATGGSELFIHRRDLRDLRACVFFGGPNFPLRNARCKGQVFTLGCVCYSFKIKPCNVPRNYSHEPTPSVESEEMVTNSCL